MNLMELFMQGQGSNLVEKLGQNFNLSGDDAKNVVAKVLPSMSGSLMKGMAGGGGIESLLGVLQKGNHQRYVDDASQLTSQTGVDEGNSILGHLFGSKEESRNVATRVSEETGVDASTIKKMLPMLATAVMGVVSKQSASHQGDSGSQLGMLSSFLDSDKDGSVAGDLLGMAKKFF